MTPETLLAHIDTGQRWPWPSGLVGGGDLPAAYELALAVRALRQARGERPAGIKIGFTNRTIWPRYNVHAPIWGTVWDTTVHQDLGHNTNSACLEKLCQPRIEPEVVFGLARAPGPNPSLQTLYEAIEWLAPGFELVQSHLPDWQFVIADTAADSGLHGQLWIGPKTRLADFATDAQSAARRLAQSRVALACDGTLIHTGQGQHVLDSPLHALRHIVEVMAQCPGAPRLQAGDIITTGTWTDAPPVHAGQTWEATFDWTPHVITLPLH